MENKIWLECSDSPIIAVCQNQQEIQSISVMPADQVCHISLELA